jgi:hypothetical protein
MQYTDVFCFDSFPVETIPSNSSHHLEFIVYPIQMTESVAQCDSKHIECFSTTCDEIFLGGVDEKLVGPDDIKTSLCLRPTTLATCSTVQNVNSIKGKPLRVLLDSGSDKTLFNRTSLPKGATPKTISKPQRFTGFAGTQALKTEVYITDLCLPEFSATQKVPGPIKCVVYDNPASSYDIIIGLDLMRALGIRINCDTCTAHWNENIISFHSPEYFSEQTIGAFAAEDDPFDEAIAKEAGYKSKTILHSKYEQIDPAKVAQAQKHLSERQRADLALLLSKYKKAFLRKARLLPTPQGTSRSSRRRKAACLSTVQRTTPPSTGFQG